jgi:hypothetical protein
MHHLLLGCPIATALWCISGSTSYRATQHTSHHKKEGSTNNRSFFWRSRAMGVSQGRVRGRRGAALQEAGCTTPGTAGAWVWPWSGAAMVPLTSLLVSYGHGLQMTHIFRTMEAPWNQPGHCRTKLVIFAQEVADGYRRVYLGTVSGTACRLLSNTLGRQGHNNPRGRETSAGRDGYPARRPSHHDLRSGSPEVYKGVDLCYNDTRLACASHTAAPLPCGAHRDA